ncbi:gliding motility protein [Chryseobacterium piperi]|uniref:Gliding motility protein n=1 Tax=Chryseobacterium piperi TaxID=558152 RepID=A0A086ATY6_9FLAO|nr:T9SS C-terminal target domain-containing protein [Chryseobacterium piperi]ASW74215.1 T9SS C-terminal target domain-containing protein [Chryseobacterium piperi]KFF20150.1 gliding motility protein [Chryseobacterium piperi]
MLNRRTRSLFLVLFLVLIGHFSFAQDRGQMIKMKAPSAESMKAGAFIDVNAPGYAESNYNITQLVKDVLIAGGSTCTTANVSNVAVSPNLSASDQNRSWGYFNKATTNFPFANGIVLVTGFARKAGNDFQGTLSDELTPSGGDIDLATALNVDNTKLRDATYIEFDFVPSSTEVSFRYLFASKEYQALGNFTCNISDGFALLLKKVGDPNYTNLAILPNGAGPVSVTNIIPASLPCGPKNAQYFGSLNNPQIETNFNGRTIPLTAKATVIPGQTYHFKMVLADYQDKNFDSAVFLEAGSFDIGVQIVGPTGVALPASINVCDNAPQVLTASLQNSTATYQWFFNNTPIPGATNPSYTATQPGVYKLQVFIAGNTCPGTASVTIVGGTSPTVQNATLTACYTPGNAVYNLTNAQASISTTPGVSYTYYTTLADANAGNANNIQTPTAYSSAGGQTIYVQVKSGFCSKVAQLQLVKAPQMTGTIAPPTALTCTNSQITLNASASVYPAGATFNWTTTGGNIVSGGNTLTPLVNAAGTYTLTISKVYQPGNITCTTTANVTVVGDSAVPATTVTASKVLICAGESVTLTASGGATYNWNGLTGNGNTQTVTPTTTTTYTVTAVGANGCVSQSPATITIQVSQPITVQNATLLKCYQPGNITYDLTSAEPQMTSVGTATFAYYVNVADANAGNGNTIPTPTAYSSPGNQTVYVLVKNGGCSYVVTLQLLKTPTTTLTIAAPQTITCTTSQITLNASASTIPPGSTIAWTTTGGNIVSGANTLNPVVNAGGTYTLTVQNTSQPGNLTCTYTENVTVNENKTLPVATLVSSHAQICVGESVTLTAGGGATYNWTGLTGNGNTQTVSPTVTTTYTVYAVGANGCVSTNPATVTVIVGPPTATVAASKSKICAGESVTLTASGGITYNWVGLTGNGNTQVVSPTMTTTYSVYALGGNGCSSTQPATITIEVVPAITSTLEDVYVCAGDTGVLDAGSGLNYTYIWSTGATTQTISTNIPGTYTVTISNGTCSKAFTGQLLNPNLPQFTNIVYDNHMLTLTASNPTNGILEYSIDGGLTWQTSNIFHNVLDNANYNLVVRTKDAKCNTALSYYTFVINNAITPNSDGRNDVIDFSGISNYNNFAASIFNRYGQELFKATKADPVWNGTLKGNILPTATYWYRVQWENPASKKLELRTGWILLKNRN